MMSRLGSILFCCLVWSQLVFGAGEKFIIYDHPLIVESQAAHKAKEYAKAEKILDEAMIVFEKEEKHREYVEAFYLKAKAVMHQYRVDESIGLYHDMANYAKQHHLDYHYAIGLHAVASIYSFKNNTDKAMELSFEVLKSKGLDEDTRAACYGVLANGYFKKGVLDSTAYYHRGAFQIDSILQDSNSLPFASIRVGDIYTREGDSETGLTYYFRALDYIPKGAEYKKAGILLRISGALFAINNLEKAKIYTDLSIQVAEKHQLKSTRSKGIRTLGRIAEARGQYELAKVYYLEAIGYFKDLKNVEEKVRCYLGLARSTLELEESDIAYEAITEARSLLENMGNDQLKLRYYIIEALFNEKNNNPVKTLEWLQIADQKAIEMNAILAQGDVHEIYANHYYNIGDYKKAFQKIESYHFLKDSISQLQQMYAVHDLEAKYTKIEQDLEIQKLAADKGMMNMQLTRNRKILGIGAAFSFLLLLLSGTIFNLYKKNKSKTVELEEKNNLISVALEEKNFLIKEIHHRVKNNLQIISSLLSLQARNIEDDKALSALKEGQSRVRSMSLIHQNLYQEDDLIGVEAKSYIDKLSLSLFHSYNIDSDRIKLTADIDDITLDVDKIIPLGLIINELITNSLKYAFKERENGNIHLSLKEENEGLLFSIADNGVGLPEKFSIDGNKSLGFRLIKAFSKKLEAALSVENRNGTVVSLKIPN